jgi:hypothetical protein
MGKPYSDDLRERVVAAIEAGHSRVKVADLYNMALSTVGGFIKRKRETGSVSPDKFGGYQCSVAPSGPLPLCCTRINFMSSSLPALTRKMKKL